MPRKVWLDAPYPKKELSKEGGLSWWGRVGSKSWSMLDSLFFYANLEIQVALHHPGTTRLIA